MITIETINVQRVAVTKRDLLMMDKWSEYVAHFCAGVVPEQEEDEYLFLDEVTAHSLGLITYVQYAKMADYNSRITLQGVKKYHWKELVNTESQEGTWDITFGIRDVNANELDLLQNKLGEIREEKNKLTRSQDYENAARLRDVEKQILSQIGEPRINFALYRNDKEVSSMQIFESEFEELIDLLKRIS